MDARTPRFSPVAKLGLAFFAVSAAVDLWAIAILISAIQHPYEPGGAIAALLVAMAGSGGGFSGALVTWLAGRWKGPGEQLSGRLSVASGALGVLTIGAVCAQ